MNIEDENTQPRTQTSYVMTSQPSARRVTGTPAPQRKRDFIEQWLHLVARHLPVKQAA